MEFFRFIAIRCGWASSPTRCTSKAQIPSPLDLARRNEMSSDSAVGNVSSITFTTVDQNSETSFVVEGA
jgi:hypothetical protein